MSTMIHQEAPAFSLQSIEGENLTERTLRLSDYVDKWLILLFYTRDFSLVCPTELTAFGTQHAEFQKRGCIILAISVDSLSTHREWLEMPVKEGGIGALPFPLASDPRGQVARAYAVWNEGRRAADRGLFVIDPAGLIQHIMIQSQSVGRNPTEVLRVLDALQTGGACPAAWRSQDDPLDLDAILKPGRVVGQYQIRQQLSHGTFGKVFAACDLRQGREVALKILRRDPVVSRERLLDEIRSTSKLSHPNICTIYSVEEWDGVLAIAMEVLPGQPLCELIKHPLTQARTCGLAGQMASGLAAAHRQNLMHGDLKPANVQVLPYDAIKILDIALAKTYRSSSAMTGDTLPSSPNDSFNFEETEDGDQTTIVSLKQLTSKEVVSVQSANTLFENDGRAFGFTGTPGYMSPEQSHGLRTTPECDTFSLGLILFEMLTGTRALSEKNLVMMILHLQETTLAKELAAKVPAPFQELLEKMLAINPSDRPTMDDVVERLQQIHSSMKNT